jgi:hypothetical protein
MRRRGEFPTDRPLEALKMDHSYLRQLFDSDFQPPQRGSIAAELSVAREGKLAN